MAGAYSVKFDESQFAALGSRNGVRGAVVYANSSADALAVLEAQYGDDADAAWANATATLIAAGADLAGWSLRIQLIDTDGTVPVDCTVTGAPAATIDSIAALMVTALNLTAPIAGAAYNSGTNVLKVAETTDSMGDHRVIAQFWPPFSGSGHKVPVASLIGTVTDQGSSGAALTVALAADSFVVPAITDRFQTRE